MNFPRDLGMNFSDFFKLKKCLSTTRTRSNLCKRCKGKGAPEPLEKEINERCKVRSDLNPLKKKLTLPEVTPGPKVSKSGGFRNLGVFLCGRS